MLPMAGGNGVGRRYPKEKSQAIRVDDNEKGEQGGVRGVNPCILIKPKDRENPHTKRERTQQS